MLNVSRLVASRRHARSPRAIRHAIRTLRAIVAIHVVRRGVLHDPRDLRDELFVVSCAPQQVEAHLHAGCDSSGGVDAALVDDPRAGNPVLWLAWGEAVGRRRTWRV